MTKARNIFLLLTLALLDACTHNDGDIGDWFGLWHVESIALDGTPDAAYDNRYYFLFQNHVFCVRHVVEEAHSSDDGYARWEENGNTLTINFVDDRFILNPYGFYSEHYLQVSNTLTVNALSHSEKILTATLPGGRTVAYHIRKVE